MSALKVPSKKVIEFEYEGSVYAMRRPTIVESENYSDKWKAAESSVAKNEILFDHLEMLGLPKEISKTLEAEQLDFIVENLLTVKKN